MSLDTQLLDAVAKLAKRQAQQLGCGRLVESRLLERLHDGLALHVLDLVAEVGGCEFLQIVTVDR